MAHLLGKAAESHKTPGLGDGELKIAVDYIESGCVVYTLNETVHILIKELSEKIQALMHPQDVKFIFTPLFKSEFPVIIMLINIKDNTHSVYESQYDFLINSATDLRTMNTLVDNPSTVIQLFDGKRCFSFNVLLEDNEREMLESILQNSQTILTKETL